MLENFIWGQGGKKMTPEQVEQQRRLVEAAQGRMGDTSPVGHWTQGAARVVDALGGVLRERRTDSAEEAGLASADDYVANSPVLASLLNGGGSTPMRLSTRGSTATAGAPVGNLRDGIIQTAEAIGADPLDLATAISYETAGTFDPMKAGPTTQWGQHRGLIQFGEPQAQQHGADFSTPEAALASQLGADGAVANYFRSSGFQPGMSGLDLYSTINAGAPGRYNASDANNGGAPGDVADKWGNQMEGHRAKAAALLGGEYTPSGGNSETISTRGTMSDNGVVAALSKAMTDPWVAKKYGPVIESLLGQQMKRSDMDYQAQLQQQDPMYQAQLSALQNPQPKLTSAQKEYELARQQGFEGSFLDYKTALAEAGRSQTNVTTNVGGESEFAKAFAKGDAATISGVTESGLAAQRNIGRIDQLESLLAQSPSGFGALAQQAAGEWGLNTEGLSEIQAAQALINSLVPEQRQPGSGPMSDADLALFKQSLPRIINQPGGNAQIIQTMRAIAQYDAEGAVIVQKLRAGDITRAEAFAALQGRQNPLAQFKSPAAIEGEGDDIPTYNPQTGKWE